MTDTAITEGAASAKSANSGYNRALGLLVRYSNVLALVLLLVVASLLSPYFLSSRSILNVLRGATMIGLVSIGMTYVILNRGIDLSAGSIVGISAALAAGLRALRRGRRGAGRGRGGGRGRHRQRAARSRVCACSLSSRR